MSEITRIAMIEIEQVRDCPHWAEWDCLNPSHENGKCGGDPLHAPEDDCPLPKKTEGE